MSSPQMKQGYRVCHIFARKPLDKGRGPDNAKEELWKNAVTRRIATTGEEKCAVELVEAAEN